MAMQRAGPRIVNGKTEKKSNMQVFVPYQEPLKCAQVLDARRLNKQIIECRQILSAIRGESNAWRNHPCVKMYRNHLLWLEYYQHCLECYKSYQELYNVDFDEAMQDYRLAEGWNEDAAAITPEFLTDEFVDHHKTRLFTKSHKDYPQWADFGTSDINWYFVDGEWLYYRNGKQIKD